MPTKAQKTPCHRALSHELNDFQQLHGVAVALLLQWQPQKLNQKVIRARSQHGAFRGSRADSGFNHCAIVGGVFGIQYAFYLKLFKQIFSNSLLSYKLNYKIKNPAQGGIFYLMN